MSTSLDHVRPSIKPHDWPGRSKCVHRSVSRTPRIPGTPWVALSFPAGPMIAYVSDEFLAKHNIGAQALEDQAIGNMPADPKWTKMELGPGMAALSCDAGSLVAERILDQTFMAQAHAALASEMVLAVIPQPNMLLAGSFSSPGMMMKLAAHFYGEEGLSDWVFVLKDGAIMGRVVEENGQLIVDAVV